MATNPQSRRPAIAAMAVLPVIAVSLIWNIHVWIAFVLLAVVIAVLAEVLGTIPGLMAAMVGATGYILVVEERTDRVGTARGGPELAALATLLVVAALFGRDRPQKG